MKKLKLVKQIDRHGCTIACLAMITGKPYFHIRTILHEKIDRLKNIPINPRGMGLYCNEFHIALTQIFKIPCKPIKFTSLRQLKNHCIIFTCPLTGNLTDTHAVVFDAENRCILDPMNQLKNLQEHNIYCCLEL